MICTISVSPFITFSRIGGVPSNDLNAVVRSIIQVNCSQNTKTIERMMICVEYCAARTIGTHR